ncbi:MAG: glycosyltransferase [Acidimicrobiaceae bacterium]|nr:glycosyltransferase [Acidimicrobiaceae bacterium]MCO5331330.1 glycosyltransferase [Ilumatobacteraceae bacterium]
MPSDQGLRVVQVTGRSVGGAAEHVLLLTRLLGQQGVEVQVALFGAGPLDDALRATGRPVHQLLPGARGGAAAAWTAGPVGLATGFVRLVRLLRREPVDIVHTHTSVAGVVGRAAAVVARVPVRVHMMHSVPGAHPGPRWRRAAGRWAERLLARVTTAYVAGSHAAAAMLRDGLPRRAPEVVTIHYSFDPEAMAGGVAAAALRRSAWHPEGDEVVVGIVGRLEPQKGVLELLPALPPLLGASPRTRVVLVGDGSLRPEIERSLTSLGIAHRVLLTGWVERGGEVMPALDVLALPSRWEPFGIVNLEAAAAGVPVVAYAVDGVPEVVADGVTGVLVPPGDSAAFVAALGRLCADRPRRAALGAAGRARLDAEFLPAAMAAAHLDLYLRLSDADSPASG